MIEANTGQYRRSALAEWLPLALAFLTLGGLLALWHNVESARVTAVENERLNALSKILVKEVAVNLVAVNNAVNGIIRDRLDRPEKIDPALVTGRLRALVESMPGVRGIIVLDKQATVAAAIPPDLVGRNFLGRPYFAVPRQRGLVLMLMLALIVVGIVRLTSIGDTSRQMIDSDWVKMELVNTIDTTTRTNARRTLELFIAPDQAYTNKLFQQIEGNRKSIDDAVKSLEQLVTLPQGKALVATLKQARSSYVASFGKASKLLAEGRRDEASLAIVAETLPALDALQETVRQLNALQKKGVEASGAHVRDDIASARLLMLGLGIAAALIAVALAYAITRSVTRPINEAIKVAQTVAAGDLTSRIDVRSTDEVGQLMQALRNMNDSLLNIVGEVRTGTDTIGTASTQIAAGNLDLSARTEEQASSLEETASSMEELTSTVRQNADNARQANVLAGAASDVAVKGGVMVARVVDTMRVISDSSRKIVDIISVIDGIAFQTNILALNAAVEAARAGEQGRGFAVVATEVRNLAQRSAAAAKEIKTLIVDSVEQVDIGARLVDQAGATMQEIVTSVKRVTDIMGEMAVAAQEQTAGIEQINQAICQMDEVTQQNAALVEEAAAAAGSLQDQAGHLTRVVGVFTIGATGTVAARPPAQAPERLIAGGKVAPKRPVQVLKQLSKATPSASEWENF